MRREKALDKTKAKTGEACEEQNLQRETHLQEEQIYSVESAEWTEWTVEMSHWGPRALRRGRRNLRTSFCPPT